MRIGEEVGIFYCRVEYYIWFKIGKNWRKELVGVGGGKLGVFLYL